ncbi:hypothetical protein L484_010133 [Morus notabilis]|uniref:DUF4408 domain-containing protein n=1 Tax=Morus notabilis TaxID=981085 RepID=W9QJ51_9ROSA|nr:hypothetical protein L484_010133 [Morus notabilis]
MDSIKIEKINAIKKYKMNQLLKNLFLYSMTGLALLFYSTPFWLPTISSSMEVLFFVYVPKLKSVFFSSKFVFVLGNLIIFALIGESKIFSSDTSPPSEAYFEEYISRKRNLQKFSAPQEKKEKCIIEEDETKGFICEYKAKLEVKTRRKIYKDLDDDYGGVTLPTEDLKKRADDFIARVNKQRIFEARELLCDVEWRKRIVKI